MKAKLSTRTIQALRPSDKPYEVVDLELKGFLLRVQPSGAMTYYLSYRNQHGKRRRYRIGNSQSVRPAQARDQAILLSARIVAGEDIQASKMREIQLAELFKSRTLDGFLAHNYEPWATSQRKSGPDTVKRIRSNFPHLMNRPLDEINLWVVEKWRSEQLKNGKVKSHLKLSGASSRPRLLTEKQAAPYIGMSRSFLRQSRMNGRRKNRTPGPPFLKIGRKVLYLVDDLDVWLLEHRRDG